MTTLTTQIKNNATLSANEGLGKLSYLLTPALDFITVGPSEADTLILWGNPTLTTQIKNNATLTAQSKN